MRHVRWIPVWMLVLLLISGTAWSASLVSADVSIGTPISAGGPGKAPGYSTTGSFSCGVSCDYTFDLATTNLRFSEMCMSKFDEQPCTLPNLVISLSNMVFAGGEILTNAVLTEPRGEFRPPVGGPFGSLAFTANSLTLTIASVVAYCNDEIVALVSFTTGLAPSLDVPEPSTIALLAAGMLALQWRRRQQRAAAE